MMEEFVDVSGLLFKRRGGFGKMMPQNWLQRYFVVSKEGFLSYYDTDSPDKINADTKPRGKIDLRTATFEFLEDQSATELGEPTPFSIIISHPGEERWKLCASSKEEYEKWMKALQQLSITFKAELKASADGNLRSIQGSQNQSIVIQPKRASTRQTLKLKQKTSHTTSDFIELVVTLSIMNLCYILASESAPPQKYAFAALATVVVGLTLTQRSRRGDEAALSNEKKAETNRKASVGDVSNSISLKQRPVPGINIDY